jgi:hypothetical protein
MKIYQLHSYSGEWEDFRDIIIGSYLSKERAEGEKLKVEAKERELAEYGKRCCNCPLLEHAFQNIEDLLVEYPDYCNEAKLRQSEYGIICDNYYMHWDEASFKIKEVEVEE